ncbi:uncharacterized protein [Chanodichthys erythropterus]|uniref:uncharacterized protein n=1 Tax=Chanodichthys erythropterus TaxID=933992 RepID=UPI00351E8CE5
MFYYVCVAGRRPRGSAGITFILFYVYFELKVTLNVRRFPPPSSHIYELCYIGAETREEGGTCCRRALTAEGDRGAAEFGQRGSEDRERLPEAVVLEPCERWDGDPDAVLLGRGGVAAVLDLEGAEESPPSAVGRSLLPSAMKGRSRGQGTRCRLPSVGGAIAGRQEAVEDRAIHRASSATAWHREKEPLGRLRTERQCVGEPDQEFFFSLFPLSPLSSCRSPCFRLLSLVSSVLTPRCCGRRDRPRGGVERSLGGTPRPARGDGGMWRPGQARAVRERREAGDASDNKHHLGGAPALSLSRRSSGSIKGGATTVEDERGPGLDFILCFIMFV